MNRSYISILFIIGLFTLTSSSVKADPLDDISNLIKAGNAAEISKYLAPNVDMGILSQEGTYSRTQADALLKDFFSKHPPTTVKIIHKLTSNSNYLFEVLVLNTSNGIFRTSFSLKNTAGRFLITEMRFEINKD